MIEILGSHLKSGIPPLTLYGHSTRAADVEAVQATLPEPQNIEVVSIVDSDDEHTVVSDINGRPKYSHRYTHCIAVAGFGLNSSGQPVSILFHGTHFSRNSIPNPIGLYRRYIRAFLAECAVDTSDFILGGGVRSFALGGGDDMQRFIAPLLFIAQVISEETRGKIQATIIPPADIDIVTNARDGYSFKAWLLDTQRRRVHLFEDLFGAAGYRSPEERCFQFTHS